MNFVSQKTPFGFLMMVYDGIVGDVINFRMNILVLEGLAFMLHVLKSDVIFAEPKML